MKLYHIIIKFKNTITPLEFNIGSDKDLKKSIASGWKDEDVFRIGDYFLPVEEILWMKVGDDKKSEEPSE